MCLISSRKDGGLIKYVQYEYHQCSSFLIEEISHVATVPTLLLKLRSLAEIINNSFR